jgi:hypothetical protein
MEQYLVISPSAGAAAGENKFRLIKYTDTIPPDHTSVYGPATLDDCVRWITEHSDTTRKWFWVSVAQYALIFIVTLAFVGAIIVGVFNLQSFKAESLISTKDDAARILITFLVAVTTVAIAVLATLTAMVVREYKERFALAKEVLTLLVGILGTIVGFYFGSATQPKVNNGTSPVANGTVNASPSPLSPNTNSGSPANGTPK